MLIDLSPLFAHSSFIIHHSSFIIHHLSFIIKITLTPDMLSYPGSGTRNAERLFDGDTGSSWFPGWNKADYPSVLLIDLQQTRHLSKLRLYDGTGKPRLRVSASDNGQQYEPVLEISLDQYAQWRDYPLSLSTRYLKLELSEAQGDAMLGELELYELEAGENAPRTAIPPPPIIPLRPRTGEALKLGSNGFHWVPLDLLSPFSLYREYQCWEWMEQEKGLCRFEPTDGASGNYDTHYAQLRARGIQAVACVNQTPGWLLEGYPRKQHWKDFKPVPKGESTTEPRSYRYFSRFLFQLAARYGRAKVKSELLTINPASRWHGDGPNQKKSGLDLLTYIEVWNEPDKWWSDPEAYFSPAEYAAMLSACYDGHEGALGQGHGIKTADPSMQVVMGGLSNFNLDYLKDMVAWCKQHRKDRRFPAEVVNFHHYSNKNQALKLNFEQGIAPEADQLQQKLKPLIDYTRQALPGRLFWFTEFGYDTQQNSPQRAVPFGQYAAEEVQAIWIVRAFLESIAAGVDAAFVYNLIDEDSTEAGLFQSSGLAHSQRAGFGKKMAWHQVAELAANLDGAKLSADHSVGQLRVYQFKNKERSFTLSWSLNDTISEMPRRH